MDWVPGVVGAVITAFGAAVLSRLRLSDRLRHRSQVELDILEKLPETSPARDRLQEHIDRQILLMVAEEEPLTGWERMDRRWGRLFLGFAVVFGLQVPFAQPPLRYLWMVGAVAAGVWGLVRTTRVERARQHRARLKRFDADPPQAPIRL